MGHTSLVFILWRITVLHCLCLIFIAFYGGSVILIWVAQSWLEGEVVLHQILLCIVGILESIYASALLWDWEHPKGRFYALLIFLYPPEHCTQPIYYYVSYLIWLYSISKYFEWVIEMNEIKHHRNFRDNFKDLKMRYTHQFSLTHQSFYILRQSCGYLSF